MKEHKRIIQNKWSTINGEKNSLTSVRMLTALHQCQTVCNTDVPEISHHHHGLNIDTGAHIQCFKMIISRSFIWLPQILFFSPMIILTHMFGIKFGRRHCTLSFKQIKLQLQTEMPTEKKIHERRQ